MIYRLTALVAVFAWAAQAPNAVAQTFPNSVPLNPPQTYPTEVDQAHQICFEKKPPTLKSDPAKTMAWVNRCTPLARKCTAIDKDKEPSRRQACLGELDGLLKNLNI